MGKAQSEHFALRGLSAEDYRAGIASVCPWPGGAARGCRCRSGISGL